MAFTRAQRDAITTALGRNDSACLDELAAIVDNYRAHPRTDLRATQDWCASGAQLVQTLLRHFAAGLQRPERVAELEHVCGGADALQQQLRDLHRLRDNLHLAAVAHQRPAHRRADGRLEWLAIGIADSLRWHGHRVSSTPDSTYVTVLRLLLAIVGTPRQDPRRLVRRAMSRLRA